MDPTACLRRINDADTHEDFADACDDLASWIAAGGFEPDWTSAPYAAIAYVMHLVPGYSLLVNR